MLVINTSENYITPIAIIQVNSYEKSSCDSKGNISICNKKVQNYGQQRKR